MMWYLVSVPAWLAAVFLAVLGVCGLAYTLKLANADADASRVTGMMGHLAGVLTFVFGRWRAGAQDRGVSHG